MFWYKIRIGYGPTEKRQERICFHYYPEEQEESVLLDSIMGLYISPHMEDVEIEFILVSEDSDELQDFIRSAINRCQQIIRKEREAIASLQEALRDKADSGIEDEEEKTESVSETHMDQEPNSKTALD